MLARPALLAVSLIVALLLSASSASASYPTTVVVSLKFPAFHGTVKSGKSACAKGRRVKLYREHSGPDRLLGTDRTSATGKWSIPLGKKLSSGTYYAMTPTKGSCRAAKSNRIPID